MYCRNRIIKLLTKSMDFLKNTRKQNIMYELRRMNQSYLAMSYVFEKLSVPMEVKQLTYSCHTFPASFSGLKSNLDILLLKKCPSMLGLLCNAK